ncbi:MAG: carbohydrate porin [Planctomycetota bacterium]
MLTLLGHAVRAQETDGPSDLPEATNQASEPADSVAPSKPDETAATAEEAAEAAAKAAEDEREKEKEAEEQAAIDEEVEKAGLDVESEEVRRKDSNDLLSQLRESITVRGAIEAGPLEAMYQPWSLVRDALQESTGLRLGMAYTGLVQHATSGEQRTAGAGDYDLFGRWQPPDVEGSAPGQLGFNFEFRHAYSDITPSQLNQQFGSVLRTTRAFNDADPRVSDLWWEQRFANEKIRVRFGGIGMRSFFDLHRFKSQNLYFQGVAFSDSPTIAFPGSGLGAVFEFTPANDFHFVLGFADANGNTDVFDSFSSVFDNNEFFTAFEIDYSPSGEGVRESKYSLTLWHTDAREERGRPSGRGVSLLTEQQIVDDLYVFARYGYGDGADRPVEHLVSAGFGTQRAFGLGDDALGLALSWARPPDTSLRDQWGAELFYRAQLTTRLQLSPGVQMIVHPSENPDADVVAVFQLRFRVVF